MDKPKKNRTKRFFWWDLLTIIVKMPRIVTIHCHIFDRCAPGSIPQQIGSGASLQYLL